MPSLDPAPRNVAARRCDPSGIYRGAEVPVTVDAGEWRSIDPGELPVVDVQGEDCLRQVTGSWRNRSRRCRTRPARDVGSTEPDDHTLPQPLLSTCPAGSTSVWNSHTGSAGVEVGRDDVPPGSVLTVDVGPEEHVVHRHHRRGKDAGAVPVGIGRLSGLPGVVVAPVQCAGGGVERVQRVAAAEDHEIGPRAVAGLVPSRGSDQPAVGSDGTGMLARDKG